jgi:hypothetical protein
MSDPDLANGTHGDQPPAVTDSATRWFLRGLAVGMLLIASINALSYFFRSARWGTIVGRPAAFQESIGFPFQVWEAGNTYGGMFVDYQVLGLNILVAMLVGTVVGWITARHTASLNRLIEQMQFDATGRESPPIQFSLRGLMLATLIVAVIATIARQFAARRETLVAIYALGPLVLVVIAMLPRGLSWQKRVVIIVPATLTLIAVAITVGTAIDIEFDKVLMGIFLCWTPQSALAALGLTASILYVQSRQGAKMVQRSQNGLS